MGGVGVRRGVSVMIVSGCRGGCAIEQNSRFQCQRLTLRAQMNGGRKLLTSRHSDTSEMQ
jgi:hypothetical protein